MSATLIHQTSPLVDPLHPVSRGGVGVNVITPVMAVSVCRPPMANGLPSRRGSASINRSRQSSAKSLPSSGQFKLCIQDVPPTTSAAVDLLSSMPDPFLLPNGSSDNKEILTLPVITSPVQLCSTSNSATNLVSMGNTAIGRDREFVAAPPDKANPSSAFPNFRALQRLAASAKQRMSNLQSKEAKSIIATQQSEQITRLDSHGNHLSTNKPLSCQNTEENVLNCSWISQEEEEEDNATNASGLQHHDHVKPKSKKLYRSRSRRRAAKTPARKKTSAFPASKKDSDLLGEYALGSTMILNTRWSDKKVETHSTRYKKKVAVRKNRTHISGDGTTHHHLPSQVSMTTPPQERRSLGVILQEGGKESRSEGMPMQRMMLEQAATVYSNGSRISVRLGNRGAKPSSEHSALKKVFLSEKQSGMLKDCGMGVPCAPPATPTLEQLQSFEYVPSMTDLRSQRALKDKLSAMDAEEKRKRQRQREDRARLEKQQMKSNVSNLRQRQRQEIYALNKLMTEHEHSEFMKFCETMKKDKT